MGMGNWQNIMSQSVQWTIMTKAGFSTLRMPRCRTMMSDGLTKEWTRATWRVTCCHIWVFVAPNHICHISYMSYIHESLSVAPNHHKDDRLIMPNVTICLKSNMIIWWSQTSWAMDCLASSKSQCQLVSVTFISCWNYVGQEDLTIVLRTILVLFCEEINGWDEETTNQE